jgi:hypothetical protein
MIQNNVRFLAPADVKYTFGGVNLYELRRAQLQKLARSLDVDTHAASGREVTGNDLLGAIVHKLDRIDAPAEVTELKSQAEVTELKSQARPKKKATKKKKK